MTVLDSPVRYQQGSVDEQGNLHAPAGGVTIGGKFFEGGKFITKDDLKNASESELQMLKMQFAGDPNAAQVLDDLAKGDATDSSLSPEEAAAQEQMATQWGKPLQVNAGNFLIRQVQSLKNAGFNVDVTAKDKSEQVRQAMQQLEQLAPMMQQFIGAAGALGFRESKAQGLIARVNNATHNIFHKAESLGWQGQGDFKEKFASAADFLKQKGMEVDRSSRLKGEVAEAALRLASRVLKVPLARAFGGRFSGNPKNELAEAAAYLDSLKAGFAEDANRVPPQPPVEESSGDKNQPQKGTDSQPQPKEEGDSGKDADSLNGEAGKEPVKLPTAWDEIPNYDLDLRRIIADSLGLDDVSPLGYARNVKLLQEAQQKATERFNETHGAVAHAIGKNLKGMVKEAKDALKSGGNLRGLSALVSSIDQAAPGALDAISQGGDKGKALVQWLSKANTLKPPAMNSPETVDLYQNHPAVAGLRDYMAAQSHGVAEEESPEEDAVDDSLAANEPEEVSELENYSYEDHAIMRDATGLDIDAADYKSLAPLIDEAHRQAVQEYEDTHGALRRAIGTKHLATLRRKAQQITNPKSGKAKDAASFRGFDLILDRAKQEGRGALDALRGNEDPESFLMEWLAEGSKQKPPSREDDRVAEIFSSLPDVSRYVGGGYGDDSFDPSEWGDDAGAPFSGHTFASGKRYKGFKTSKGSTYDFGDGGTTKRNKSLHAGHDKGDVGEKKPSEQTLFLKPEHAQEIGMWQSLQAKGKRILVQGDEVLLLSDNPKTGKKGLDGRFKFSDEPSIGSSPLELWDKSDQGWWRGNHPGNEITELYEDEDSSEEDLDSIPFSRPGQSVSYQSPYGSCPHCGSAVVTRERRPNGNDACEGGHVYPSKCSVQAKGTT